MILRLDSYPPLTTEFGAISINVPHETLVFKSINGITTQEPFGLLTKIILKEQLSFS